MITRESLTAAATDAAALALASFRTLSKNAIHYKSDVDLVTDTDRSVQQFLFDRLRELVPEAQFLAEEQDVHPSLSDEPTFIIDPIDGTINFVHGVPWFCVSVAYAEECVPRLGAVVAPALQETFSAERGEGAYCNGELLEVSRTDRPVQALGCTGLFGGTHQSREGSTLVLQKVHPALRDVRRMGAAALDLAYLAAGRFDLFWEGSINPWDIAAAMVIVEEAGGIISAMDGSTDNTLFAGNVLAANPTLHRWFVETTSRG